MTLITDEQRQQLLVNGESSARGDSDDHRPVVKLFTPDARKLYDLEHLWAEAPRVDWKAIAPAVAPRI